MTLPELTQAIMSSNLTDDEIHSLWDVLKAKQRQVRDTKSMIVGATLKPGDKVKLSGLRPKQINGLVGEVVEVNRTRAVVKLPVDWRAGRLSGGSPTVPLSCLEVVA